MHEQFVEIQIGRPPCCFSNKPPSSLLYDCNQRVHIHGLEGDAAKRKGVR